MIMVWQKAIRGLIVHHRLWVLLIFYLTLAVGYNIFLPIVNSDDHDEGAQFRYLNFIFNKQGLPVNVQEREAAGYRGDDPPLYPGLATILFSWVEATDDVLLNRPEATEAFARESLDNWIFQTVRFNFPFQGSVLLFHLSRFYSSVLGAGVILITSFTALELFPGKKTRALMAAMLLALIPRFIFMSSSVSDDNMNFIGQSFDPIDRGIALIPD